MVGFGWLFTPVQVQVRVISHHGPHVVALLLLAYQCMVVKALRHHSSFSCLLFNLLFLFLTNDMTPPPPPPPPPPCVPPMAPRPSPSKTLSFTLFFQKQFAVFTTNELPPCFHHCDHKASMYNCTLWQPLMYEKHLFELPGKWWKPT